MPLTHDRSAAAEPAGLWAPIHGLWDRREAGRLSAVELCAYASRLIGSDSRLVLWGGGNSSVKTEEADHAGRLLRVLWVKASGFDMKTISASGFTALRLGELQLLRGRARMTDEEMTAYLGRCQLDPKAAKGSIETLLHAFVPFAHVYHTHADAVAGFTCTPGSRERTRSAFGRETLWVPYVRPGFELSKSVAAAVEERPGARAMILDKHGALTWGETAEEAYEAMIRLVQGALDYQRSRSRGRVSAALNGARAPSVSERRVLAARLNPWLRGAVSRKSRMIVRWTDEPRLLAFLARPDAERLVSRGPFCPDHTLQIKARQLFLRLDLGRLGAGEGERARLDRALEGYRRWYGEYFKAHAPPVTPSMDSFPRVVLVPGLGAFAMGKDFRQAGIAQEIYRHTVDVLTRVSGFAEYTPLDLRHLGDIEFWPLETYKLRLQPPEAEFSRRVVLVTGAAGAIGSAVAGAFCAKGAHVVLGDIDLEKAKDLEERLDRDHGRGSALAVGLDVGSEASVRRAFEETVLRTGGLDILFSNAGIAKSAPIESLELADWERSLRVNATGHFLCVREAMRLFKSQGLGGAIVVNATKNVLAPGKEFAAYSASKAAAVQLARVLALEGGEHGVRVNMVNPDAVFEGSGLWSREVRRQRAKAQGIAPERLEEFYAQRNLLKARVTASDVAEAVLFLASERSAKTTGALLPVDGGLREAFPR